MAWAEAGRVAWAISGPAVIAPESASAEHVAIATAVAKKNFVTAGRRMQRRALRTGMWVLVAMRPPSARVQTARSRLANGSPMAPVRAVDIEATRRDPPADSRPSGLARGRLQELLR